MELFGNEWFGKHQKPILAVVNAPLLGRLVRRLLTIPEKRKIVLLAPSAFHVATGKDEYEATFYTRPFFAQKMRSVFAPLWWVCHFWDWLTRPFPGLNLGFDTLRKHSDAGTGDATVDGYAWSENINGAFFSTLRDRSGDGADTTGNSLAIRLKAYTAGQGPDIYVFFSRAICTFDTESLPDTCVVTGAEMAFYGTAKSNGLGECALHACAANPTANNNLIASDFGKVATGSDYSKLPLSYKDFPTNGVTTVFITFNSSGISAIDKKGITKIAFALGWDVAGAFGGTWAADAETGFAIRSNDDSAVYGIGLNVTYRSGFVPQIIFM